MTNLAMTMKQDLASGARIGIIGAGFVAAKLFRHVEGGTGDWRAAFVHARRSEALDFVPEALRLEDLNDLARFSPTLVVEAAHPDITRQHGEAILRVADYMPLSVTALADPDLLARLQAIAAEHGHRLLIPHGALVGLDSLVAWRDRWTEVTITFRKPPSSIDLAATDFTADAIVDETVVYDGPVGPMAKLFPRNVNAMVTCALATVGVDRCRGRLIADPTAAMLSLQIEAVDADGARLFIERRQPAVGVSGSEMFASLLRSVEAATGETGPVAFL
jgi:aspartate dehydrogenase